MDQNTMLNNTNGDIYQLLEEFKVLAIDDNIVYLKILSSSLKECKYKVKVTTRPTEALEILRKKEEIFDIVITDVEMPEMDGFQLLEIISTEMDIPVIMISASDDRELIMKGVRQGARDYLVKPVRMEELKNIWQHIVRKNMFNHNHSKLTITRVQDTDNNSTTNTISFAQPIVDEQSCPPKKSRVSWSNALHHKFLDAYKKLGQDAVPKKILEVMNEPNLSRENVASHLQKHRNEMKKRKNKLTGETNIVAQDLVSTKQDINNVVKINGVPSISNQNHCLIQQNQQISIPPTYGNYFHQSQNTVFTPNLIEHQPTVFTLNPVEPQPTVFTPNSFALNRSFAFSTPNQSLSPSIDSGYASFGNALNSTANNYDGNHQPYNLSCSKSYADHSLQVIISQPPEINVQTNPNHQVPISQPPPIHIQTNHNHQVSISQPPQINMQTNILMPSSAEDMTGFEDPTLLMGGGDNYAENELIKADDLLYNQQQQMEGNILPGSPIDEELINKMISEFLLSEPSTP